MGVQDRDWWREAHRKATYDPKQFRRSATQSEPGDPLYPREGPREPLPLASKVATVIVVFIAAVVACLHKSHLI